jgi:two-component system response regulator MprA
MDATEPGPKVLVVDDDAYVTSVLERALRRDGYAVETARDGQGGLALLRDWRPDAAILDIVMPGLDGLAFCRIARAERPDLGILMLTARDASGDQIAGLDAGADDYLVKPFSLQVLAARLRAVFRRREPTPRVLHAGDLELDSASRVARRHGREIPLTATEYRLLLQFVRAPGRVIPKSELSERVWGNDLSGNDNVIEVYVGYLRTKLEAAGEPRLIHTLRGAGYLLRPVT